MSRDTEDVQNPGRLNFQIRPEIADRFRKHCQDRGLIMGKVITRLLIAYLIQENDISDTEDFTK